MSYSKAVIELARLIEADAIIRMYVDEMLEQVPGEHKTVRTTPELLDELDRITRTAPLYHPDPGQRNFFPMSTLLAHMMMTTAGEAVFRNPAFNEALRSILKEWCSFLDSGESRYVLNTGEHGWLSPSAYEYNKLHEFVIPDRSAPHWGWPSYNAYFHRQIKPELRPVDVPDDPEIIVSATDGAVYKITRNVQEFDQFWLKGHPYSLSNMLNHSKYTERFLGGDVFQSYLRDSDYHRFRAPVDGVVQQVQIVEGLMFSHAESAGYDPTGATYSQAYGASVNTRGLVFIESEDPVIGMVCVLPVGITEISSITITVSPGDTVKKGDELGYFSFGGSSVCLVFQPGTVERYFVETPPLGTKPDDGPALKVSAQIAITVR